MIQHRTAQRLRVIRPVLQSQNKLQLKKAQELQSSDFEGSRFDRWFCQGSGQHPLAGSPQDPRTFSFYYQSFHQGRDLAGFNALVIWLIWPSKNVIRSLALARSSRSCLTNSLSLAMASLLEARSGFCGVSSSSGKSIRYLNPPGPGTCSDGMRPSNTSLRIEEWLLPSFKLACQIVNLGMTYPYVLRVIITYLIVTLAYYELLCQGKQLLGQLIYYVSWPNG